MSFQESGFVRFMASAAGRGLRIVAGLGLIGWGYTMRDQTSGAVLMLVGLLPLAAGIFDFCLLAPLFGAPFSGKKIRTGGQGMGRR